MGIARISHGEAKDIPNNVQLRFKNGKINRLLVDCKVFPLFCGNCQQSQTELFLHLGSRYGQVGSTVCEFCGQDIAVVDHDNVVDSIVVNGEPCSFEKLYLLSADYIEWLEEWYDKSLIEMNLSEERTDWLSVDQLRERLEKLIGLETDDRIIYQTDQRFKPLPSDINRWINLLEKSSVPLPAYVLKQRKSDDEL